jgi:hypothetical protein
MAFAVFALLSLCLPGVAAAQWVTSGDNISNTNAGNVGVGGGTATPSDTLSVWVKSTDAAGFRISGGGQAGGGATNAGVHVRPDATKYGFISFTENAVADRWAVGIKPSDGNLYFSSGASTLQAAADRVVFSAAGRVGVGTASPQSTLHIQRNADGDANLFLLNAGGGANSRSILLLGEAATGFKYGYLAYYGANSNVFANSTELSNSGAGGLRISSYGGVNMMGGSITFNTTPAGTHSIYERMRIDKDGKVGVGTVTPATMLHVAGDITVDGNINAKYQDVAEWVPSKQKLNAGTIVVLDPERPNHVLASTSSYDTAVAGVISSRPGLTLGEAGEGKALVATTGRVKVKVDATRAPIKIGDLLVTSDAEGVAMKSEPLALGGVPSHRPGTIIGKALEPLAGGKGEILVLLSLQ